MSASAVSLHVVTPADNIVFFYFFISCDVRCFIYNFSKGRIKTLFRWFEIITFLLLRSTFKDSDSVRSKSDRMYNLHHFFTLD